MENSTKKCRECKADIPLDAKVCQFCKTKQWNWFSRHKILTFLWVVFLIWLSWSLSNTKNSTVSNTGIVIQKTEIIQKAIKINAKDLFAEYEANEIQADEKYKNQILEVSGVISNIWKDLMDNPYIALKTNNVILSVQCMLDDSEKSKAAKLKKDSSLTVTGKNSWKLGNVMLRDCKIQ